MTEDSNDLDAKHPPDRMELIKDIIGFQFKLVVDGMRDFILVPVSLLVGFVSLVKPGDYPGTGFYTLLRAGKNSEHLINLFSAADKLQDTDPDLSEKLAGDIQDIDALINKVEHFAKNEYNSGGLTQKAREHLDQVINSLRNQSDKKDS